MRRTFGSANDVADGAMAMDRSDLIRPDFRVIAEGDDAVGADLTLREALAVLELAKEHGKRHVAIVDDTTGALVDQGAAREWVAADSDPRPDAPTSPDHLLVPCPACQNEHGEPVGAVLVQLPSGTWVRETCETCWGLKKLDREGLARYQAQVTSE